MANKSLQRGDQKDVIRVGMVDFKLVDKIFFLVNVRNPWPAIRRARIRFLRIWVKKHQIMRKPDICLFFEIPGDEWLFVHEKWCGESKIAKRLSLDRKTMMNQADVIDSFLRTYKVYEEFWETWRKNKIAQILPERRDPELRIL